MCHNPVPSGQSIIVSAPSMSQGRLEQKMGNIKSGSNITSRLQKIPEFTAAVADAIAQGRTTTPVHCSDNQGWPKTTVTSSVHTNTTTTAAQCTTSPANQQLLVQTSQPCQQMAVNPTQLGFRLQQSQQGTKLVQIETHGRTYLVEVWVKKPIDSGEQIVIKTNQPEFGGSGLIQEVMDEVLR